MRENRYDYAVYATLERAEKALEDMFATGEVSEAERPHIRRINPEPSAPNRAATRGKYAITLVDGSL